MDLRTALFFGLFFIQGIASAAPSLIWANCFDVTGREVIVQEDEGSKQIEATFHEDTPLISWDSSIGDKLSKEVQTFLYAHACAHHSLGHTYALVPESGEKQADCWAANTLIDVGIFLKSDLVKIEQEISQLPDYLKSTGALKRNVSISACFEEKKARTVAKDKYSEFEPDCKIVMVEEEYEETELVQTMPEQVPCQHCTCLRWGECICQHAFDTVERPLQQQVTRTRFVPKEVCTPRTAMGEEY